MSEGTLLDKVWERHRIGTLKNGQDQLAIDLHLIHEVTSPQAFAMLRERRLHVLAPDRTVATVDHIVPTVHPSLRPYLDNAAEKMMQALEQGVREFGIKFYSLDSGKQGIVHVIGPELGLTQPGMTIACGDSHTSTHGAFGSVAFGIGTTELAHVLATQSLAQSRPGVRRIEWNGELGPGVYAKDVILATIGELGINGGKGFAYEFAGTAIDGLGMEGRMTICNMTIEGGAKVGYVNPDQTTFDYVRGREFAPTGDQLGRALRYWKSVRSEPDAKYDDVRQFDSSRLAPQVTWGTNPGQVISIDDLIPRPEDFPDSQRAGVTKALAYIGLKGGERIVGTPIDWAFIGACTNSRISDLREAASFVAQGKYHVAKSVTALVVPGSQQVKAQAEMEGLDTIFKEAGFQWRDSGCSMCLGMNPDQVGEYQRCAASSNRNFEGRQGRNSRGHLMSPVMVAAAAVTGQITDARELM